MERPVGVISVELSDAFERRSRRVARQARYIVAWNRRRTSMRGMHLSSWRDRARPRASRGVASCEFRDALNAPSSENRRAVESTSDDEMKSLQIVISRHGPCGCARRRRRRASSCADDENGDGSTDAERRVSPTNQSLRRDRS